MANKFLIVGLGNPGEKYEYTRHNIGFLVLKSFAERYKGKFSASSLTKGYTAEVEVNSKSVTLLLPATYMNNSGVAVKALIMSGEIDLDNVLVVTDDINLDFAQLRIRKQGSDGGHNGLKSIIEKLGSEDFARLRIGVGLPKSNEDPVEFVLESFTKEQKNSLEELVQESNECVLSWLEDGMDQTMNHYNRRKENG